MMPVHDSIYIRKLNFFLPETIWSNEDLIAEYDLNLRPLTVEKMIGIRQRHWAPEHQAASDLAVEAIIQAGIAEPDGPLWVSTISPDYLTPNTASRIKGKLHWYGTSPAIDINSACSGFLFGIENAMARLIAFNEKSNVVVATEVRSRFLNKKDRRTVFLFGDGACAAEISSEAQGSLFRIVLIKTLSQGNLDIDIWIPAGGSATPITSSELDSDNNKIKMRDGTAISEKIIGSMNGFFREALAAIGIKYEDVDYFVFHQAQQSLLLALTHSLGLSEEKVFHCFADMGNTSSSSIGIVLTRFISERRPAKGSLVCALTMGAGDHLGMALLEVC